MKFGGSSVADAEKVRGVAQRLVEAKRSGLRVVGTVSAMGKTTDSLIALAHEVSPQPDDREMDMLLSTGERISCALVAMAIHDLRLRGRVLHGQPGRHRHRRCARSRQDS
jgi:aspartate kinase